ncbi:hypothetical protein NDU88_003407 [Pleurodeles waltl]|uniref:Uncharacterized protein n=1 Tax=Pleurodeles waltl TaxID=8319 RepID=A0AAV7UE68_PLEWA|nr:hypothetical protein NDU88_003407 [Pleurodeles waltl]
MGAAASLFPLQLPPVYLLLPPTSSVRVGKAPRPSTASRGPRSILFTGQSLRSSTPAPTGLLGFGPGIRKSHALGTISVSGTSPRNPKQPPQHLVSPGLWSYSHGTPRLSSSSATRRVGSCPWPPGPVGKWSAGAPSHPFTPSGEPMPHLQATPKAPINGLTGRGSSVNLR